MRIIIKFIDRHLPLNKKNRKPYSEVVMLKKMAETFLYHIWDEQHLQENLQTRDEQDLKILFQGKWNNQAGPDFKDAIILLNNKKVQGDVEIHRYEADWYHHEHQENRNFNDVVLHVIFEQNNSNKFTISECGNKIPILIMKNNLDERVEKLWDKYGNAPFDKTQDKTILCKLAQSDISPTQLSKILFSEGENRFEKKCKRFSAELYNSDFNQILYKGIMEALGYSKNKSPFLRLASKLTYNKLQKLSHDCDSPHDIFCILSIYSGIDPHKYNFKFIDNSILERYQAHLERYKEQIDDENLQNYQWNFFRLRPTNHPLFRMWQISPFLFASIQNNIINRIMSIFSVSGNEKIKVSKFPNLFYDILNPDNERLPKIGKSRCDDIFFNIILPVAHLYAKTLGYQELAETIIHIYKNSGKLSENHITRFVYTRLKDKIPNKKKLKLIHQQGLIQHYYRFCTHFDCQNCLNNFLP